MKKKKLPGRARNTLAKKLRSCGSFEERWLQLLTGSTRLTERQQLVYDVLEWRKAEQRFKSFGSDVENVTRQTFARWRTALEQRTGSLIFRLIIKGDVNAIVDIARAVEKMEKLNTHCPPESDPLRLALLKLFRHRVSPRRMTWNELEAKLAEPDLHAGGHDRNHIRRVMKQLRIWKLVEIPAKRKSKPGNR